MSTQSERALYPMSASYVSDVVCASVRPGAVQAQRAAARREVVRRDGALCYRRGVGRGCGGGYGEEKKSRRFAWSMIRPEPRHLLPLRPPPSAPAFALREAPEQRRNAHARRLPEFAQRIRPKIRSPARQGLPSRRRARPRLPRASPQPAPRESPSSRRLAPTRRRPSLCSARRAMVESPARMPLPLPASRARAPDVEEGGGSGGW